MGDVIITLNFEGTFIDVVCDDVLFAAENRGEDGHPADYIQIQNPRSAHTPDGQAHPAIRTGGKVLVDDKHFVMVQREA